MKFCLEVGELERHVVDYSFNQLLGESVIKVNNREIQRAVRLFNEPLQDTHTFRLDSGERIVVRIEKERKWLFGQKYRVFVNERLVKCYEGV